MTPPIATTDPGFRETAAGWIAERGEVLIVIRFSRAGGVKEFHLIRALPALVQRLAALPPVTSVIVLRQPQLPVRGRVDDSLASAALDVVAADAEHLLACPEPVTVGSRTWHPNRSGVGHGELREDLEEFSGQQVTLGPYPPRGTMTMTMYSRRSCRIPTAR
jgi:hypothetical protein